MRASNRDKQLTVLAEAISLLKERSNVKFDETLEIAMNLGVDPRHARPDGSWRRQPAERHGPHGSCVPCSRGRGDKADEALAAGADIVGAEDLVETVQKAPKSTSTAALPRPT